MSAGRDVESEIDGGGRTWGCCSVALLRRAAAFSLGLLAGTVGLSRCSIAAVNAASVRSTLPSPAQLAPLASATSLLLLLCLPLRPLGLARPLLTAAFRCIAQLSLLGGVVLSTLFRYNSAATVIPYMGAVAVVAAAESASRTRYDYPTFRRDALTALAIGCGSTLAAAAALALLGPAPWYNAGTLIPVGGMLFGNAVSALSLCADSLLSDLHENSDRVELLLARAAAAGEAAAPPVRSAVRTALTPTVNALSVCGLVHIPGVMTGSILAGMDPARAGRSQAVVMMLIASSSTLTVLAAARLILNDVLDFGRHRVRSGRIRPSGEGASGKEEASALDRTKQLLSGLRSLVLRVLSRRQYNNQENLGASQRKSALRTVAATGLINHEDEMVQQTNATPRGSSSERPMFVAESLPVPRTNLAISFQLSHGDKLAIMGRSGVGKTQLLRRLALLEQSEDAKYAGSEGGLALFGHEAPGPEGTLAWRRNVCWVPQHRPTLPGTPRGLYDDVLRLRAQCGIQRGQHPIEIASGWGLEPSAFDRPWSSLSGGEVQRSSLAIALSLQPNVLLLDEPTGACDAKTTRSMENALDKFCLNGGCVVLVTHSREQADRFCTHVLELD